MAGRPPGVLVVFAKAPRPGLVKTRMSPALSQEEAAELYGHMLDDVLGASRAISEQLGLEAVVAGHPDDGLEELARHLDGSLRVIRQRGRNLAERMRWASAEAAAGGARRILLRGSDSPTLGPRIVEDALDALDDCDLALSPDQGGGYGLVALRRPAAALFDHPMSTSRVLDDTRANAERLGLRIRLVGSCIDVDRVEDLDLLAAGRSQPDAYLCQRTLDCIDSRDLWRRVTGPTSRAGVPPA